MFNYHDFKEWASPFRWKNSIKGTLNIFNIWLCILLLEKINQEGTVFVEYACRMVPLKIAESENKILLKSK